MKFYTLPVLLVAALVSAVVVIPFLPEAKTHRALLTLEAKLASTASGRVQVYYDTGTGFSEAGSASLPLARSAAPLNYALPLPAGTYLGVRFDPVDHEGTVTIESLRVVTPSGAVLRTIPLGDLKPAHQIAAMNLRPGGLEVVSTPGANDPQLSLAFTPPLEARNRASDTLLGLAKRAAAVFVALAALLLALEFAPRFRANFGDGVRRVFAHPGRALAIGAAVAVIASAYPVIFLGKSYVSPNFGTSLLYDGFPTLPGSTSAEFVNNEGSDVGAIMWAHIPYSFVQHRALAQGELPLWNRYNSLGSPLLGQGQSMFGDPLHFFVILANGESWAWDLKFLIAKWGFALALGLLVLAVTRYLPAALIVAAAAPFIGFFVYRINHPAFFSLCYAPWSLYCWVRVTQAFGARASAWWAAGLIVANAALMNSGTAKEAYMLLLTMNFAGACVLLMSAAPLRVRLAKLAGLAWAGVIFVLLTAPVWATFLHTLANAQTAYDAASAYQIQPSLLLGLFDEAFYRPVMAQGFVFNPALNFLLLLGVLYFLVTLRLQVGNRIARGFAVSSLLPLALAFGLIPPAWIVQVPFLANVAHIDNTFSCGLIILWSVLAGSGFAAAAERLGRREGRGDLITGAVMLFALVFAWIAFRQTSHRPIFGEGQTFTVLKPGQVIAVGPFLWGYLASLLAACGALAWAARRALVERKFSPVLGLVIAVSVAALLWRTGLHANSVGYEEYGVRPPPRVDFHAKSEAVTLVQSTQANEPSRAFGMHGNFFAGWTSAYGLEAVNSPDALMNKWCHELIESAQIPRPWAWDLSVAPEDLPKVRPFFDALNVRYYLDLRSDQAAMGRALKLVKTADLDVYESPTVWPRAFFTDRLELYDSPNDFVAALRAGDGRPFAAAQRSQLADDRSLASMPRGVAARTIAPATNYRLTENTTSFDIHANGPGVVVLNEVLWPGDFRVEVNGRKAPVLRVNHAFKGVQVDAAGDYRITFRCLPKNFPRNAAMCGIGAFLLIGSLFVTSRRPSRERR